MTIAIISATKEKETDGVPYAFLPIFSDYSIEWQIKSASHLGIDHFIFVSANLSGVLLNLVDSLRKQGVTADIVRDCKELSLTLPPENTDPLLFLDDGVGFEPAYLQQFLAARIPVLLVTEHDDKTAYLERIDLNHRWTGIALFAPNLMENMADVPADWDVGSALLRAAIQSDYRREVLTTETVVQGSLYHIQTRADGAKFELRRLAEYRSLPGHFVEKFIYRPLAHLGLPHIWRQKKLSSVMCWLPVAAALLAILAASIQWSVFSFSLLLLTSFLIFLSQETQRLVAGDAWLHSGGGKGMGAYALMIAAVAINIFYISPQAATLSNMLLFLLGAVMILLSKSGDGEAKTAPDNGNQPGLIMMGGIGNFTHYIWFVSLGFFLGYFIHSIQLYTAIYIIIYAVVKQPINLFANR